MSDDTHRISAPRPPSLHRRTIAGFSDYRLPQLLRAEGILKFGTELEQLVASEAPVAAGSRAEVEIRAATLAACELVRKAAAAAAGRPVFGTELDYYLWRTCVDREVADPAALPKFHRTRTISY